MVVIHRHPPRQAEKNARPHDRRRSSLFPQRGKRVFTIENFEVVKCPPQTTAQPTPWPTWPQGDSGRKEAHQ
nr:MAG TPA: hypothetical protein [Caudoviricetes sp.]